VEVVKKGLIGAAVAFVGGYLTGFASGVRTAIDLVLSPIPEITESVASTFTLGFGKDIGRKIGNQLVEELWKIIDAELNLSMYMYSGVIIALIGLWYANKSDKK
jgi:hypothetical protein